MAITILWCGGEDFDFKEGTNTPSIGSGNCRSYARCGLHLGSGYARSETFAGGEITSGWLSFRGINYGGLDTSQQGSGLGKSGTTKGIFVGTAAASGTKIALCKYDGASRTELATEVGNSITTGSVHKYDMHISNYGETCTIKVYFNGNEVISWSGDARISGLNGFDCAVIAPYTGNWWFMSEFIVADGNTRTMTLCTNYLTGSGDVDNWNGAWNDIDEETLSDADYIDTDVNAQDFNAALADSPVGSWYPHAVRVAARIKRDPSATVDTVLLGVKSGGSTDLDAGHLASTDWAIHSRIMHTINVAKITTAIIDAMQLALRSST